MVNLNFSGIRFRTVVLEIGGYPLYDNCIGLYVNATSDEGHDFLVDSGATTIYPF